MIGNTKIIQNQCIIYYNSLYFDAVVMIKTLMQIVINSFDDKNTESNVFLSYCSSIYWASSSSNSVELIHPDPRQSPQATENITILDLPSTWVMTIRLPKCYLCFDWIYTLP